MTVELEQIADEAGIATPDDESQAARQWSMWMADALLQIKVRLGPVQDLDADVVDFVVRKAVAEKVKHPDAVTSKTSTVDEASVTRQYEKASGQVTIQPEWWAMLSPAANRGRAFTINPVRERPTVTFLDRPDLRMQWAWPYTSPMEPLPEGARDL